MSSLKKTLKKIIPTFVLQWRTKKIAAKMQQEFGQKTVAETFDEIYQKNLWGGNSGEFYSGDGSTAEFAAPYAEVIKKFVSEHDIQKVVDLGCGDFRVASTFVSDEFYYTGCDIVPSLVNHLNEKYASEKIAFRCVNILDDKLPEGDVCLIRQVLQHLSNDEVSRALENAKGFKYLIVTEHFPNPAKILIPNLDIPHGPDMRISRNSAIVLDEPPFNRKNIKLLLDVEAEKGSRLKTFVIEN